MDLIAALGAMDCGTAGLRDCGPAGLRDCGTAMERQVCLDWLDQPELPRTAVEDLSTSSFIGSLQAAARHDGQARAVLEQLSPSPDASGER